MLIHRAYVFRLEPTPEQAEKFASFAGACRAVYNIALEQRQTWGRRRRINWATQSVEITELRQQFDWLGAVPRECLDAEVRQLDTAYQRFFHGEGGYPKFKKKGDGDGFRITHGDYIHLRRLTKRAGAVKVPKIGWVRLRGFRSIDGELRGLTITRRAGHWWVSIEWQREIVDPVPLAGEIGIDRGVAVLAATSAGEMYSPPSFIAAGAERVANLQRKMERQAKGSTRRLRTLERLRRVRKRIADARKDYLHKLSTQIAKSHGTICIEKLKTRNMTASAAGTVDRPGRNVRQKAGLNQAILDRGWSTFATMLRYKAEERGGRVIEVPAAYTSQTCSSCGCVDATSRKSQAAFACTGCGFTANADHNAALNVLAAGLAAAARGSNDVGRRKREPSKVTAARRPSQRKPALPADANVHGHMVA